MKKILVLAVVLMVFISACSEEPDTDALGTAVAETLAAEGFSEDETPYLIFDPTDPPPTETPEPTLVPTFVQIPTLDSAEIQVESQPNYCQSIEVTQEDIDGEMLMHGVSIYQNSAIGAAGCATIFEGRWYQGYPPTNHHHVTAYFGAGENVSVYQGSEWRLPVGVEPRELIHELALGKCDNWDDAQVGHEPLLLDYVDLETMQIMHLPSSCEEVREYNPLLEEDVGLIPARLLPHFRLGYTWGGIDASSLVVITKVFSGESLFDEANPGMTCNAAENPLLGDNEDGTGRVSPNWDAQCQYLLDGELNEERAVMLIKGKDVGVDGWKASIWSVNPNWNALEWADEFASANCPMEIPVYIYDEDEGWTLHHTFECP